MDLISVSNFIGLGINHNTKDKKKEICTIEQTILDDGTTINIQSCENRILNKPRNVPIDKLKLDWGIRIKSFSGDGSNAPFNNPAIYLIGRISSGIDIFGETSKENLLLGLSLSSRNRQPIGSLIFQLTDVESLGKDDVDFEDVLSAKLAFGLSF